MDDNVRRALDAGGLVDITTTGRRSGAARRIEIALHNIGGRLVISGMPNPRKRSWIANLDANPSFILHLKRGVTADLPAIARIVTDPAERRDLLVSVARNWRRTDVDEMVANSPLIELTVPGYERASAA